jgi:general secretion pathway protein A
MYERFYNLRERPFSLSPDPDYLYPSRVHKEALSYLRYGIEGHAGFIVITGEIGSGKTTLLQTALRGLDHQTSVSRIVNTMLDARELIEAVMLDFGLDPGQGRSKPLLLRDLARYLVDQRNAGRMALLVIDEAQNLSMPALEEVRMLSNLETEKSKLIQIALIGQPNLREVLARPELEQLRQRVTVSYHLQALDAVETSAYINHRLRRAAIGAPLEFSRDVTDLIHLHSQGIPRKINVIADAVLLFGYGEEQRTIGVDLAYEVLEEL